MLSKISTGEGARSAKLSVSCLHRDCMIKNSKELGYLSPFLDCAVFMITILSTAIETC